MIVITTLLTFLCLWALFGAMLVSVSKQERAADKLKYYDEEYQLREKYDYNKKSGQGPLKKLSHLLCSAPLGKKQAKRLETELVKADMLITAEELMVVKILSSSALAFLTFSIFKDLIISLVVFVCIWNLPRIIIAKRKKDRIKQFDGQLNEGITIVSNSLKSGYSFLQAVMVVAEETRDPFSKEFKKLLKEMSLGIAEEDALRNLVMRVESEDLKLVINAILIQKDIGGNLAEILENISETIRERQKIKNELKTLTAQGRLSGIIVALLPVALAGVIYLLNKDYIVLLFTHPVGLGMIFTAILSEMMGFIMIKKIVTIDT